MNGRLLPEGRLVKIGDDMVWPAVNQNVAQVEWQLRYSSKGLDRADSLLAAAIISAYFQMVNDSIKKRNAVCKAIREASDS